GAASGFAKKNGVKPDDLRQAPKDPASPADLYLLHVKKTAGRDAREVLPGVTTSLLRGLAFPKRMSWDAWLEDGKGTFAFGRPIRWLVSLLDGAVVPLTIYAADAGQRGATIVQAGDVTWGHRFLPRGPPNPRLRVRGSDDLRRQRHDHCVDVLPESRAAAIQEQLKAAGAAASDDFGLFEEWKHLVEWPTVVFGKVPEEFRTLPTEVLQTVLVHHQ